MSLAPIVLFVYNRPEHTQQSLDALAHNIEAKASELIVYSDGPNENADTAGKKQIEEVRKIVRREQRFKSVKLVAAEKNKGLANSVIDGVSEVVNIYGKVIVMEDDLIASPHFLRFMNDALTFYEDNNDVVCATGYIYPVMQKLPDLFFLKGADCWGWCTWKRGWDIFERDGNKLLQDLLQRKSTLDFDFYGSYPYTQMLEDQIAGKNKSWAIRWYASAFLQDKLTLYPGRSLIRNIGFDGTGTHSGKTTRPEQILPLNPTEIGPIPVLENKKAKQIIADYFRITNKKTLTGILKNKINLILQKFNFS